MKDPFYAGLLFQIENIICQADDEAQSKGIRLTDSQIKSVAHFVRGLIPVACRPLRPVSAAFA